MRLKQSSNNNFFVVNFLFKYNVYCEYERSSIF